MGRMLQAAVALAACLLAAPSLADDAGPFLSLERYTPDQGLSQHAVTAMAEDDRGLLWVGTQEGLNRFDGHRFTVLRSVPGDDSALASSSIESLEVDSRSRLWVGTNDAGLEVIDLRTRTHTRLGTAQGLGHPTVTAILLDADGGAWLGTANGIDHVDPALHSATRAGITATIVAMERPGGALASPPSNTPATTGFALDAQCRVWRLSLPTVTSVLAGLPGKPTCIGMAIEGDTLWLGTASHGLFQLDTSGSVRRHVRAGALRPDPVELTAMLRRPDGEGWWLGYADGAVFSAPAGLQSRPLRLRTDTPVESAITRMHLHRSGVLWLGSATSGLYRARALSPLIRRDRVDAAAMAQWPSRSLRSIHVSGERLLVGTDLGLVVQDAPDSAWREIPELDGTAVRAIAPARGGGWWIGTHRGVWRLSPDLLARPAATLPNPLVTALLVEGDTVWVATRGGLARLRGGKLAMEGIPEVLQGPLLTSLLRDDEGRLWMGSNENGAYRWDPDGRVQALNTRNGRLPHDSIWSLHADADAIWMGAFSGGLLRLDRSTGQVRAITNRDGLSNNVVYRIVPDAGGRLWLTTNYGISVYDPATGMVQALDRADGLFNLEYNSGAGFVDEEGLLYLGGTDGLDVLRPDRLASGSAPATPVITGLRVLGRKGPEPSIEPGVTPEVAYADLVELGHRDRVFSLDLVAMDHTAPNAARLRYRIAGHYDDWVYPDSAQASVLLSYLPPGEYPLEVQAAGRDGRFGPSRQLLLVMQPPPWRHPLAYAGYGLLGVLLLIALVWRLRAQAREKRLQIERLNWTVAERTDALKQANRMLVQSNQQLEQATRTDPLTQVSNRRDLQEWMDREGPGFIGGVGQPGQEDHFVLFCMIDIDDFKRINDGHGHQVGDQVLVEVAGRLRKVCRERDILVRWGGEEFLLVVRDAHLPDAAGLAERIRDGIAGTPVELPGGSRLPVTASIGVAPWPLSTRWPAVGDWEQSVSLADRALYAAKAAGKNAWVAVVPGQAVDRSGLLSLLAGTAPTRLPDGCVEVLHSTRDAPEFDRA
ncbi:ligand-binding sensor domain-containing diguanylate cyclase [Lysobacter sp. A3-1-A15]|uniref:ligand-binding sensor domain-containing diguanylate cyclase n=1 Tax=Novilysobacter viscosus TaxID=3098602 RepID=UPI002ED91FF2